MNHCSCPKSLCFILIGIIIILIGYIVFGRNSCKDSCAVIEGTEINWLDEPGQYFEYTGYKVIQVLSDGGALASPVGTFDNLIVYIPHEGFDSFFDDEIVDVLDGYTVRVVGTYRYKVKGSAVKTVPAIRFFEPEDVTVDLEI